MNRRILFAALLAGAAVLGGCKKEPPAQLPPEPVPTTSTDPGGFDPNANAGGAAALGTQEHFVSAVNGQNVIYFDTDRFNVDSAAAAALQTQAQYLLRYPNINVTLEGHADERGTREYNLALGERRANAARDFLVANGVPATRLMVVSWGKERPVAQGSNEAAWAQNRRAVTVIVR